jgi:lysylphosphatidylglycerol synthetase-like protein (DUF2156 family)
VTATTEAAPKPPAAPSPEPPKPSQPNIVARYLRTAPASVGLAVILVVTSIITGTMFAAADSTGSLVWGVSTSTTIKLGYWWTPATALFIPNDLAELILDVVLALTLLAIAERLLGTIRVIIAFAATGIAALLIGVLLQWLGGMVGDFWSQTASIFVTFDPTVGIVGALITASAFASALWRRRIRLVIFAVVLMFVLFNGDQDNYYRLIAGLLGLLLGSLLRPGAFVKPWRHSSHSETRNLVAIVVGISGIGPLVALLPPGGLGPLSFISDSFSTVFPDADAVLKQCDAHYTANCDRDLALVSSAGVGPILLSLIPLLLLVVAALGLRRGRRFAWILAIVVNGVMAALALASFGFGSINLDIDGPDQIVEGVELLLGVLAILLVPVAMIIVLIATRRHFTLRAPIGALRRFWLINAAVFVVLALIYFIAGVTDLPGYVPDANVGLLLLDTVRRFIPPGFETGLGALLVPEPGFILFLYQWIGIVFWAVFIVMTFVLYNAMTSGRNADEEQRFLALLKAGGGGTLGFMGTWPGNVYWFSEDGQAAVAYRVIQGVAITMSDPVCTDDRAAQTIREFAEFCDTNSWTPVFYSFHEQFLHVFQELDWQYMSVGEETLMRPVTLNMAGKPWQKVRQALNRGTKEGVTTLWTTWDELPITMVNEINAISEQWVAEKELPEMGFTLGAMEELKDPEVALFLAIGTDGSMQAITSWLPSYRDGRVVGWTIDFMRRGDNSLPGIMEFVIASAALKMKEDGIEVLSLSGAPLAQKPLESGAEGPEPSVMTRLLEFLAKTLEPAYGFSSLFKFKSKFNPEYSTIYMAYPDPVALATIGSAIGKAYLPDASPQEYVALARTLIGSGDKH